MVGIVLTMHNPTGQRIAQITFSHYNLSILLIALMIILVSWIMHEGYQLSDEQKFTI